MSRRQQGVVALFLCLFVGVAGLGQAGDAPCGALRKPTDVELKTLIAKGKVELIDRLLAVIEEEIVPKTRKGVRAGNKLFGAAILKKSDLSTVIAVTNNETGNPLNHGEIQCIYDFYAIDRDSRPASRDTIFMTTHEPCPLCLSGITWGGWDNFFYLFSYEDTKDAFNIPHDLELLDEIFRCPDGSYSEKNAYWSSWGIQDLISQVGDETTRKGFEKRVQVLRKTYDAMSDIYQKSKGTGAEIPLE